MTEALAYKPKDIPAITGIAYTRVREAIDSGELPAVRPSPNRQIVTREALVSWLASMPAERVS